jgi:hypothetical protein
MLSERGIFWWSDTTFSENQFAPEGSLPGVLTISESGRIKIELEGELPKRKQRKGVKDEDDAPGRSGIAGFIHSGERYILSANFRARFDADNVPENRPSAPREKPYELGFAHKSLAATARSLICGTRDGGCGGAAPAWTPAHTPMITEQNSPGITRNLRAVPSLVKSALPQV